MSQVEEVSPSNTPGDFLRLALGASDPTSRARYAEDGLALDSEEDDDLRMLLLRQLYLASIELRRLRYAAEVAERMCQTGALLDVAHQDASRAYAALGESQEAIAHQRLAARHAPPSRRSFHLFCLATLQHFKGSLADADSTLRRAERWAEHDRPLIRAYRAYLRLLRGVAVKELEEVIAELKRSPAAEAYGQYLLGMIAHEMGDQRNAAPYLRAFLRRHASADVAKSLSLREELRRARVALAEIESD